MNKITYIITGTILLSCFALLFSACGDDDNNSYKIDEAWKTRNEALFEEAKSSNEYNKIYSSESDASTLYILAKESNTIITSPTISTFATSEGYVEFTDTVVCRYEGWLFNKNNEKIIFDSTENPVTGGITHPNYVAKTFSVSGVIEGWRTALSKMKVGDELEIVIPQELGYGAIDKGTIKPYTTLYFRIKLLRIIPMKGTKRQIK